MPKESEAIVATKSSDRVYGTRPSHTHNCPEGHRWLCNSPYCEDMETPCVAHGGLEPIVQGREPWRGFR